MKFIQYPLFILSLAILPAAQADSIHVPAFSLSGPALAQGASGNKAGQLLSNANGVTTIAVTGWQSSAGHYTEQGAGNYRDQSSFNVAVNPGYRITGFSFTGTFVGVQVLDANPGVPNSSLVTPGAADNGAHVGISLGRGVNGAAFAEPSRQISQLNGSFDFELSVKNLSLSEALSLSLYGGVDMFARAGEWVIENDAGSFYRYYDNYASMNILNPTLTVYYAPALAVPEPESYAMLLLGLAFMGMARRRKSV
ncbi:PEP-CTERM sorting domain-containing protein [Janthinobacterium fluminis]|uniref:PEP-CTERM sorting domain-containing protein n=1 Tax=Janthinobacterium fluminis TaxID=2987524 RepID=A0ABT5JXD0_9BURK|nr:PEP-CTERM sorting domain-containing protein [Janthinobacterium fluminis]MDC8757400.1 PEP-CTERM sorting domain-containing protein [Janthinobacterium fluminis]